MHLVLADGSQKLDIVIEEELVRMRPQAHLIDLLAPLITYPGLDQILGKHFSFEQKLMILLQAVDSFIQSLMHG